jgi:magnesium chelatase subunit H
MALDISLLKRSTMQRLTMVDKKIPMRVSIITMDTHLSSATERARYALKKKLPSLELSIHAASSWTVDAKALEKLYYRY